MPLVLEFKSRDKIIINGAVIENGGPHAKLVVHNQAAILRGKEILSDEDAKTPASRIYFSLQCAYIFPGGKDQYLDAFSRYIEEYLHACPSAGPMAREVVDEVKAGRLYKALRASQKLIKHEATLVEGLEHEVSSAIKTLVEQNHPEQSEARGLERNCRDDD